MPLPVTVLGHGLMDAPPQRPAEEMIKHYAGGTLQAAKPGFLTGSDECGLMTGVGSRVFHHSMMARRAGERGERMFGVMGEGSVGRG